MNSFPKSPFVALAFLPFVATANCVDGSWRNALYDESSTVALDEVDECLRAEPIEYLQSPDINGEYLLHNWALRSSNAAVLALLLDAGASIDVVDSDGNTPLHVAVAENI